MIDTKRSSGRQESFPKKKDYLSPFSRLTVTTAWSVVSGGQTSSENVQKAQSRPKNKSLLHDGCYTLAAENRKETLLRKILAESDNKSVVPIPQPAVNYQIGWFHHNLGDWRIALPIKKKV